MNHLVMVLGDTSINAFETSGLLAANDNICVVLASTERATIEALDRPGGFRSRFPDRVFTAYLKPAPTDFAQVPEELSLAHAPPAVAAAAGRSRRRARPRRRGHAAAAL